MTYKVEVIADSTGKWYGNAMVYPTWKEADEAGYDLSCRWTAVREYRVAEVETGNVVVETGPM